MGYHIKLLPIAYKDLQTAKKWYNEKRNNLGEEFKKAVIAEIDYIQTNPEHYQIKYKATTTEDAYFISITIVG